MPNVLARLAVCAAAALLALMQSDGCGFEPPPDKGLGEPCTRSSECESSLVCSGGVCMEPSFDAGPPPPPPRDAGDPPDSAFEPPPDASMDAAVRDAAPPDATVDAMVDAAPDAPADGGAADAMAADATTPDAMTPDADASLDGGGA